MYKVLIADDEDIICRGLASMVSQREELQVVALAEDGEIALEKAKETRPDLMFVDINMPFLNGLEFMEKVQDVLPEVLIVIVTGYDDFEYVQKALQLGASDYVLKPVMEKAFFEVLDKSIKKLKAMDESREYVGWMEQQVEQNRARMIDDLFNELVREKMEETEFRKQMGYLKIQVPVPYMITTVRILSGREGDLSSNDHAWYLSCCDAIQKCFHPDSEVLCFQTEEGAIAVISKVISGQRWKELEQKLRVAFDSRQDARVELAQQQGERLSDLPEVFRRVMELCRERSHYSDLVLRTISMIRMQWEDSELTLQSVADALFVSPSYLSRVFHRETGENFASYLARKRMNEAKVLLKNTNLKMYEIAEKTGYTSQHYFSNAFKRATGISPADYRKNLPK